LKSLLIPHLVPMAPGLFGGILFYPPFVPKGTIITQMLANRC
jgi:hypothetical protein